MRNLAINTDSNNLIGATKSMDKAEIQRLKELVRLITVVFVSCLASSYIDNVD